MRKLVGTVAVLIFSSQVWADPLIIEGHVFNRHTGVPLESAQVVVGIETTGDFPDFSPIAAAFGSARTDSNGFYRVQIEGFEVDPNLDVTTKAYCRFVGRRNKTRSASSGQSHPIPSAGFHERNLYISVPSRVGKKGCNGEPEVILFGD